MKQEHWDVLTDEQKAKMRELEDDNIGGSSHTPREFKKMKFSSLSKDGKKKEFAITPDFDLKKNAAYAQVEPYAPKEEIMRQPFDENSRLNLPGIDNALIYRALYGMEPQKDPQSCYVVVHHKGMTYHLFNAKRMPIGRIAVVCSQVIRGKNKPGYDPKGYKNPDKCVIVNMGDPYMTGRKRQQKVYRHHTGYPGGLKEFTFKDVLAKDPNRILNEAIQGMMPKNSLRHDPMKHITIFHGPYHDLDHLTLPQFRDE